MYQTATVLDACILLFCINIFCHFDESRKYVNAVITFSCCVLCCYTAAAAADVPFALL